MKETFLVFEPLNHMFKVIIAAKARGLKVIVFHSMPLNFPSPYEEAKICIDEAFEVTSWSDYESIFFKISSIEATHKFVGTYAAAEITLYIEALVREKYALLTTPPEVICKYLDKFEVRKQLCLSELSHLNYFHKNEVIKMEKWPFSGKAFFKPCCGAGSTRVKKCESFSDVYKLQEQWNDKTDIFPLILREFIENSNDYFLEEAVEGELVSVECLTYQRDTIVLGVSSRSLLRKDQTIELGASFPYQHDRSLEIIDKVIKAHKILGITHGPTHTEVIVSNSGAIEIIEVNLRMAGSDMLLLMNAGLKTNIENILVGLSLGEKPSVSFSKEKHVAAMQLVLAPSDTKIFETISFPPEVDSFRQLKPSGTKLNSTDTEGDYVGSFIVSAENNQQLISKVHLIRNKIRINGELIAGADNNEVIVY
ncbi:hypothetical protein MWMV2_MWMV2_03660 [Acinetobacter oleivorans]|uniref:ATP-grasp domain-containing protein n=1 Tax=Acinetobacter oleivorans TaxID=1148157 RepID=UPI00177E2409|nr:ATP-grasp domain-containing protein [Acinetobacter oleivorans]CAI3119596.1 hypothetical protein MWMV5_MWMV5_03661 [Acinetobacter oleivorans]CAI3119612.1 hypothetical protein MWMV13_MWMV13_03662 [Acinetobacter oleivorans]CAI3119704.1 hypothetical protein MWMV2_MWMV2_03660 [Acinetobacter oleivorans]CAI3120051.1 hypothetical protein MWMV12_MWMV12_03686 [Acinetobacter oleivorans]CAI3120060.1 hypothetical protein MWMV3_MWMV3_03724 [Acinetobacter oleivorans]